MTTLRVGTFNVHHCKGMDGVIDLERTAATIVQTGADLIALQEIDRNVRQSGGIDQAARLQELTGMHVRFFPTTRFGGGEFGLAVAARDPLDLEFRLLPKTALDRSHGMILSRPRGDRGSGDPSVQEQDQPCRRDGVGVFGVPAT